MKLLKMGKQKIKRFWNCTGDGNHLSYESGDLKITLSCVKLNIVNDCLYSNGKSKLVNDEKTFFVTV